ncbi:TetR family transcriptional regulator [Brachybacterium sp. SGAir0954]|uniref:TetR/AcrR family transcriptional regulator n=1 Tax=Brachybacterium sp. SGAir0954 TaxID=2571029 RepID=UPI0010CD0A4A|nr:TetR/AcrR family transcriptional regulator [Brachybacterium sp. SGAir0954]QCR54285.1 TetR family transcriptional regulator [Brachybacterium sp. SGAir0954]
MAAKHSLPAGPDPDAPAPAPDAAEPSDAAAERAPEPIGRPGAYSKGVARRQEILDRAIEVFRERGADGTSLRRIATAIGVSHAALLHYFDSREQLLVAVYQHAETRRGESSEYRSGVSAALDAMIRAAEINVEVPGLVQLYSTLVAASLETATGPAKEYFAPRFESLREELEQGLRAEQEAGTVRADVDPGHVAALLIAASDGLQIQWLLEPSIALRSTLETFAVMLAPPA